MVNFSFFCFQPLYGPDREIGKFFEKSVSGMEFFLPKLYNAKTSLQSVFQIIQFYWIFIIILL